jgi:hypothetical protein
MDLQPRDDDARPARSPLDLQVEPLGLEVDPAEAVSGREGDPDVVDRHHLLAERHVVVRQGVEGRRVEVAVEVDDEALRAAGRLPHDGRMDAHRRVDRDRLRARRHPVDRVG